jgi:hypothetical protein
LALRHAKAILRHRAEEFPLPGATSPEYIAGTMDEDRFWDIIEESRRRVDRSKCDNGNEFHDEQIKQLHRLLMELPLEDLVGFHDRFFRLRHAANRRPLWGAAYWLGGGCGNDGFSDFRSCLISLGKEIYRQVLNDPDALADIVDRPDVPYMQSEGFQYVPRQVYRERTGQEIPFRKPDPSEVDERDDDVDIETAESDYDFEDEEEVRRRLPRIYAKFPDMGD